MMRLRCPDCSRVVTFRSEGEDSLVACRCSRVVVAPCYLGPNVVDPHTGRCLNAVPAEDDEAPTVEGRVISSEEMPSNDLTSIGLPEHYFASAPTWQVVAIIVAGAMWLLGDLWYWATYGFSLAELKIAGELRLLLLGAGLLLGPALVYCGLVSLLFPVRLLLGRNGFIYQKGRLSRFVAWGEIRDIEERFHLNEDEQRVDEYFVLHIRFSDSITLIGIRGENLNTRGIVDQIRQLRQEWLLDHVSETLAKGRPYSVGEVTLTPGGLSYQGHLLVWDQIGIVAVEKGTLKVYAKSRVEPFWEIPHEVIDNYAALLAVLGAKVPILGLEDV